MTDGLGEVDYEYNSLSQLTAETRDFTDTLTDAPNGVFRLGYSYEIGGGLKAYTDPYADEIIYTHNKVGRLSNITGSSFGGVTNYASGFAYRAWGALKYFEDSNGYQTDVTFDNRLRATTFEVDNPTDSLSEVFLKSYQYYKDGRVKLIDEASSLAHSYRYDRLFTYDHQGRVVDAKSGVEAHGETETDLQFLPYRQTYSHDALGQTVSRNSTLWNYGDDWGYGYTFVNGRVTNAGFGYDDDGRQVSGDGVNFKFDAAGHLVESWRSGEYELLKQYDGVGSEGKRSHRTYDLEEYEWTEWKTVYLLYSTVLGRVVTEAGSSGKKKLTYLFRDGVEFARQGVSDANEENVAWVHRDPSGFSSRTTSAAAGAAAKKPEELDGMGNNVGAVGSLSSPPRAYEDPVPSADRLVFTDTSMGDCAYDGILMPCSMAQRYLDLDSFANTFYAGYYAETPPSTGSGGEGVTPGASSEILRLGRGMALSDEDGGVPPPTGCTSPNEWRKDDTGAWQCVGVGESTVSIEASPSSLQTVWWDPMPDRSTLRSRIVTQLDKNEKKCRRFLDGVLKQMGVQKTMEDLFDEVGKKKGSFVVAVKKVKQKDGSYIWRAAFSAAAVSRWGKGGRDIGFRPATNSHRYTNFALHELFHRATGKEGHEYFARMVFASFSDDDKKDPTFGLPGQKDPGQDWDNTYSNYISRMVNYFCKTDL
jgi:hypothetical protein